MGSPAKPFACVVEDCGMTFTNEDHLTVHSKKHDMALQLGLSQKATAFPADQTPTPTRFIRNCEEVGLFQDLQNVNPFDEGFKRAMEAKTGMLISLDSAIAAVTSDDALHTPHIFPNLTDGQETTLFNTRKDIPKRSSGDESSTVVESSTKHTNETTRNIENDQNINSDKLIKFHSNTQICKADYSTIVSINEGNYIKIVVNKDISDVIKKDVMLTDAGKVAPPIISQQSLDFAIDSLTSHVESKNVTNDNLKKHNLIITSNTDNKNADVMHQNVSQQYISSVNSEQNSVLNIDTLKKKLQNALQTVSSNQTQTLDNKEIEIKKRVRKRKSTDIDIKDQKNYEVMIKLPNGELVHMKSNAIEKPVTEAKQKLKDALENKIKNGSEQLAALKDADTINAVMPVITTDNIPVLAVYGNVVHKKATVLNGSVDNNMLRLPKLAPAPANVYPVALVRRKVAIPAFEKVDMTPYKNNTLRSKSVTKMPRKCKRKSQEVTEKPIQHKSDCEIFEKLYGQCNKNCGENDKNTPVDDNDGIKDTSKTVTSDGKVENVIETHLNITETPEKPEKTNSIVYKVPNYYETNTNTDKVTSNAITTTKSNALNTFPNTHLVIHSATVVNTYNLNPSILVSDTVKSIDVPSSITLATQRPAKDIPTYNIVASEKIKPKQTEAEFKREMSAAAVKRYRTKQLLLRQHLIEENKILMENNQKLSQALEKRKSDMATLKKLFIEHLQSCSTASELREKYAELFEPKTQAEKNDNG